LGTNELLPFDLNLIKERIKAIEEGRFKQGSIPPLWDGKAAERIATQLAEIFA
jgi:UDP-N-acetylglucosamine 2-epimerase (non-hydrolysing)